MLWVTVHTPGLFSLKTQRNLEVFNLHIPHGGRCKKQVRSELVWKEEIDAFHPVLHYWNVLHAFFSCSPNPNKFRACLHQWRFPWDLWSVLIFFFFFLFLKEKPVSLVLCKVALKSYCCALSPNYYRTFSSKQRHSCRHTQLLYFWCLFNSALRLQSVAHKSLLIEWLNGRTREVSSLGNHYSGCPLPVGRFGVICGLGMTCMLSFSSPIVRELKETRCSREHFVVSHLCFWSDRTKNARRGFSRDPWPSLPRGPALQAGGRREGRARSGAGDTPTFQRAFVPRGTHLAALFVLPPLTARSTFLS